MLDPPDATVETTPAAPDVTVEKTPPAPDVTVEKAPPAPDVIVEATPPAPDVTYIMISSLSRAECVHWMGSGATYNSSKTGSYAFCSGSQTSSYTSNI
jgi:hypothetical protein